MKRCRIEVAGLDLARCDLLVADHPVDPDLEVLVGEDASLTRHCGAAPVLLGVHVGLRSACSHDLLEACNHLLTRALARPLDGPTSGLYELTHRVRVLAEKALGHDQAASR